jgi:2-dehydropantoate 2-reductase
VEASADPSEIGRCDIVLLCVKFYDTIDAVERLRPLIGDESAAVSLQDGVDNEQKIADLLRPDHVMGGAAFILAHIAAPGVVEQTSGLRRILFGELDGSRTTRADLFLDEMHRAGHRRQGRRQHQVCPVGQVRLSLPSRGRHRRGTAAHQ